MKKMLKKLLSVALVFTMIMCLVPPVETQAAAKTVTLKHKKWHTNSSTKAQTVYHKIKVPKDGYIKLEGYGYSAYSSSKSSIRYRLCNSKKKALTKWDKSISAFGSSVTGRKAFTDYVAVKKGTYYIKVNDNRYKLKYTFKAVKDQGGSSKAKARNIARGKTVKGLVQAGGKGSKIDWYKITLPKSQKIKFTYNALACDWIQFKVVNADPRVTIFGSSAYCWAKKTSATTRNAFPAGTYYIQVTRMMKDEGASGYYTVSWK